jgi:hypothetical protein
MNKKPKLEESRFMIRFTSGGPEVQIFTKKSMFQTSLF